MLNTNETVVKGNGKYTTLGELASGGGEAPKELGGLEFRESDEHKPQYKLPDSDEWVDFNSGGGSPERDLIWTNSETASYSGGTVTIPSGYDTLLIELSSGFVAIKPNKKMMISEGVGTTASVAHKIREAIWDGNLTFSGGMVIRTLSTISSNNGSAIPLKVYGVKGDL